jgi:hypothetical protein
MSHVRPKRVGFQRHDVTESEPSGTQAQALQSWDKRKRFSGFSPDMKDTHGQPHRGYIESMIRTHVFRRPHTQSIVTLPGRESVVAWTRHTWLGLAVLPPAEKPKPFRPGSVT